MPWPPPGDLHDLGIEPRSPALQVDSLPSEPPGKPSISSAETIPFRQNEKTELVSLGSRFLAAAAAKSFQSCPTLCDPIDGSPPGSPVPGIL